jgi:hypothetical protein
VKILSHRGYWKTLEERNSPIAFERSFWLGFGTETDVRDCAGKLVISHDMPSGTEMSLESFLEIYCRYDKTLPLALNIKSDGIALKLADILKHYDIQNWFTFDMSVPDHRVQLKGQVPAFARMSEYEPWGRLVIESSGIWLDAFENTWYNATQLAEWLESGKHICIVSPELHKRAHTPLWQLLRSHGLHRAPNLMLCTDLPEEAAQFFAEEVSK